MTAIAAADAVVELAAVVVVDEAAATAEEVTTTADEAAWSTAVVEVAIAAEPSGVSVTVVKPLTTMAAAAVLVDTELVVVADPESAVEVSEVEPESAELEDDEPSLELSSAVSMLNLHVLTSWTAGSPLLSVIGVKVITQVSVIGPTEVIVLDTVVTVVESARAAIGKAWTALLKRPTSKKRQVKKREIVNIIAG